MPSTARHPPLPPHGQAAGSAIAPGAAAERANEAEAADAAAAARRERDRRLADLLAAASAGDGDAFECFYEQTFAYARTVARRLLRDAAEVEDLLADCYFEAWRSVARFDPARGSAVTWLLTLVRSRGVDALRAAAARPDRASGREGVGPAEAERSEAAVENRGTADLGADTEADPAERLWRRQATAGLHAALATLSAAERWVLGLAYLREMPHAEIARCTGMPLGTVKSHALRAQRKLRCALDRRALVASTAAAAPGSGAATTPP
ncbi:MAG: sigma-70 family RNA polymerase sigma factor [Rubrivivax sp.]|nr:sigma-70 family RNA polymerase sigma factor [Rubrivivax sp.]